MGCYEVFFLLATGFGSWVETVLLRGVDFLALVFFLVWVGCFRGPFCGVFLLLESVFLDTPPRFSLFLFAVFFYRHLTFPNVSSVPGDPGVPARACSSLQLRACGAKRPGGQGLYEADSCNKKKVVSRVAPRRRSLPFSYACSDAGFGPNHVALTISFTCSGLLKGSVVLPASFSM